YNPNIHRRNEYDFRTDENIRFAEKHDMPFVDAAYDADHWFELAKGMANDPEPDIRCTMGSDMRWEKTAEYAAKNGFDVISSSLGISRWKNMEQINDCGLRAASRHPNMAYWTLNWRKKGGSARMLEISKREKFYMQ